MKARNYTVKKDYSKPKAYRAWKLWQEDDFFVGIYKELGESEYRGTKFPTWTFEIVECSFNTVNKEGKVRKLSPGDSLQINYVGSMKRPMEEAEFGDAIMIEYFGKKEVLGHDDPVHTMKVQAIDLKEEDEEEEDVEL